MGQFARTFQPALARALTAQGELFFDSQGNVLAQWNSHLSGGGLGLAEDWVRDLQCGLHDASIPYLWEREEAGDHPAQLCPSRLNTCSIFVFTAACMAASLRPARISAP